MTITCIPHPFFVQSSNDPAYRFPVQESLRAPHIAHQLGEAVLVEIDNHHTPGLETKDRLDETGTYRPGPTNDTDLPALDFLRQPLPVRLDIRGEHTDGAEGDVGGDEVGEVEHKQISNIKFLSYEMHFLFNNQNPLPSAAGPWKVNPFWSDIHAIS